MLMRVDAHGSRPILSRRGLLLTPLLLAGCKQEATRQRVDPALAPLIPPDTTMLFGARLDHLKKTSAWDQFFPAQGSIALESLKKQTGLDIRTTTHEVVYCSGGKHRVALIRGKFVDGGITNAGLEPELKIEGAQKFPYKGFSLVGKEEEAVTFFNSSVAAVGRASALRQIIDNRELKNSIPMGLLAMVDALPPEAHFYVVSNRPELPAGGIGGIRSLPLALTSFRAYLDLRTGASLRAEASGASNEDAKKLHDAIKALVGLARVANKDKDLAAILDGIRFFQEGQIVKFESDLSRETLRRGFDLLDSMGTTRA